MMRSLLTGLSCIYSLSLFAATFYTIDTTSPLHCCLSANFQNRIMIEQGRIEKVVASECERLSIQMEEMTGQVFIYARDLDPKQTSISIVSDSGVIQDIYIHFIERMPEVVILQDPEITQDHHGGERHDEQIEESLVFAKIEEILSGNIPKGYIPYSICSTKWIPKKGIDLKLKSKLEGPLDTISIYEVTNTTKRQQTLLECELECDESQWVYLESNTLNPKQKILSIISVAKYE